MSDQTNNPTPDDIQAEDVEAVAEGIRSTLAAIGFMDPEWGGTPDDCRMVARAAITAYRQRQSGGWLPKIGDEVRVSEACEFYGDWQRERLWVVGLSLDRIRPGINVTVAESWPIDSQSNGFTDGFYVGRPHQPDDLAPAPPTPEPGK